MCFICGRGNCMPSFHSIEEQLAFEPASDAYENYLDVRDQCIKDYIASRAEDEEEEDEQ